MPLEGAVFAGYCLVAADSCAGGLVIQSDGMEIGNYEYGVGCWLHFCAIYREA